MESSKLIEVTVISAEGLLLNRRPPPKNAVSITVKADTFNSRSTSVHAYGGTSPSWNEKLLIELPPNARCITVEAQSAGTRRLIGKATIPVSEFSGGYLPDNYLSFLSYRLRDANGEKNGILNLSVKVKGSGSTGCAASYSRPWMGVPALDCAKSDGIVTGIPVPYRY